MNDITVPVNLIAVFSAAVASMSVGYLWYGPLFGKLWMKEMGMKGTMSEAAILGMAKSYAIMFVGSLVMAYVLAHAIFFASTYLNMTGLPAGIMSGFWNWLGFVAPVTLGSVLWEGKSWKLWILNNGYWLVTILVMGVILSGF
ncbi:MAG: DUF1761 domain-containing protein [Patescibacteria group bacterium]